MVLFPAYVGKSPRARGSHRRRREARLTPGRCRRRDGRYSRHQISLFSARRAAAAASSSTACLGYVDHCHPPRPDGGERPAGRCRPRKRNGRLQAPQAVRRLVAARPLIRASPPPPSKTVVLGFRELVFNYIFSCMQIKDPSTCST